MQIEYEATFTNIDKGDVRARLKHAGAILVSPEMLLKRVVFNLPKGHEIEGGWLRVRQQHDGVTVSLKVVNGSKIENQRETMLRVDNFEAAVSLLSDLGASKRADQESRREIWELSLAGGAGTVEICIDEWPFLESFVEVEGLSEAAVRAAATQLGFDYRVAKFCSVGTLYEEKYGVPEKVVNEQTPRLVFDMRNPFLK